ncbi:hypothetical protein THASP1DRAFT_32879 [Thamnocephalis sphaerospora]|uniref:Uncharacterized protein n=1 Tax=Thamnocephalis sphaerospora TaxID=78915 RepID=A0A4P9XHV4_9FUNG|nr:hypothetical protein THASP1DRAFT_32879 [Thamnocephalis sphaerospora]|eukprot:RKP05285.1 hypothetical protein THASP1DRAFT_32879 [Thamnocephalis sphaerospora]
MPASMKNIDWDNLGPSRKISALAPFSERYTIVAKSEGAGEQRPLGDDSVSACATAISEPKSKKQKLGDSPDKRVSAISMSQNLDERQPLDSFGGGKEGNAVASGYPGLGKKRRLGDDTGQNTEIYERANQCASAGNICSSERLERLNDDKKRQKRNSYHQDCPVGSTFRQGTA